MVPTRADRCCYVLHSNSSKRAEAKNTASDDSRRRAEAAKLLKSYDKVKAKQKLNMDLLDKAIDLLTDPIYGSPSKNQHVCGVLCLHVDDLFMAGDTDFFGACCKHSSEGFSGRLRGQKRHHVCWAACPVDNRQKGTLIYTC